jgi:hypothetical protein
MKIEPHYRALQHYGGSSAQECSELKREARNHVNGVD